MPNPLYSSPQELNRPSGNGGVEASEVGRTAFRKDFARLLHAPSFRRLQGKTQLFPGLESDFFRNRLTHSLEVAQIARGIAAKLNRSLARDLGAGAQIDEDLVEFAAIAHDLGHPPFGHNGEHALDELMYRYGGFEGNAQTLRILALVERKLIRQATGKFTAEYGLDLTYRTLASVLKYDNVIPFVRKKGAGLKKGYYKSEEGLVRKVKRAVAPGLPAHGKFKTIECSIMDIADDIAYSTYDLEDSLHGGFVTPLALANELVNNMDVQREVKRKTDKALRASGHPVTKNVAELVDVVVDVFGVRLPVVAQQAVQAGVPLSKQDAIYLNIDAWRFDRELANDGLARTRLTAQRVGRLINAVELVQNDRFPQLSGVRLGRAELLQVEVLKHLNYELVIRSSRLAVVEHRGKDVIKRIFEALVDSDGDLLPDDWKVRYKKVSGKSKRESMRVVCDFIACMTDRYAAELYQRLFDEGPTIFKPL